MPEVRKRFANDTSRTVADGYVIAQVGDDSMHVNPFRFDRKGATTRNLHKLTLPRSASGVLWAAILVLFLAACGTLEALPPSTEHTSASTDHAFIATVDINDNDTPEVIAATWAGASSSRSSTAGST